MSDVWSELERSGPESVTVGGVEVRRGSRVRLSPRAGRDAWDTLLAGRLATVERIEEEVDGTVHVVVVMPDDPARQKFFFGVDELEVVNTASVLVAGIGNLFLGDDGFGCAVAEALADTPLPEGVEVHDFGVRGLDLAYALSGYDAAVLVDAVPLGDEPGTVALIEPQLEDDDDAEAEIETHGMDPVRVLRLARRLGGLPQRTLVVGCEPETVVAPDDDEVLVELSPRVRKAVDAAVELVRSVVTELVEEPTKGGR
jgi:hydrogenase maturation protease